MLLSEKEVRDNIRNRAGNRVFYLAKGDQLTSAARDFLSRERIEILPAEQARPDRYQLLNGGYLEEKPENRMVSVPDFTGLHRQQAAETAGKLGLYLLVTGNGEISPKVTVTSQSIPKETPVPVGTTITLEFTDMTARD